MSKEHGRGRAPLTLRARPAAGPAPQLSMKSRSLPRHGGQAAAEVLSAPGALSGPVLLLSSWLI